MKISILFFFSSLSFLVQGQFSQVVGIPVSNGASTLDYGFNGGTNNPQFARVDLNNDGILDLYYFDKIGNVSMTYLYDGSGGMNYTFAPKFADRFPDMQRFVLLRDYNGDGIEDIFALDADSGGAGMQVHRGMYINDSLSFERLDLCCEFFNVIYYEGNSGKINLLVPSTDYPAIQDLDGDGDLDILTFSQAGFKVDYFENQSVERGYGLDSLQFIKEDDCWGRFAEQGVSEIIDLGADENTCAASFTGTEPIKESSKNPKHAGSTISLSDLNGDGLVEAFLGDISYSNITKLSNAGTSSAMAWMNGQENNFPANDTSVDLSIFPASFFIDLDNDGLTDFIAASHNIGNTEDYESVWFYKNIGTEENKQFALQTKSALVEQSVDFGTGAHPTFIDENGDGLLDIIVGNFSFFKEGAANDSRLFLLRNTGSTMEPAFELVDNDWMTWSDLNPTEFNFSPTFGDIDMDGDLDLMVGSETGKIHFARNNAGPSSPMTFDSIEPNYLNIDVGVSSAPFLFDINEDGYADLLVGERSGNINLFTNTGDVATPFNSDPDDSFFGQIDVREQNGFGGQSTPLIVEVEDEFLYFSGSQSGNIHLYKDISLVDNSSTLVTEDYEQIKAGWNTHPAMADINADGKFDLLVGNQRGGLTLYTTSLVNNTVDIVNIDQDDHGIHVYPNPTRLTITIMLPENIGEAQWESFSINGQLVEAGNMIGTTTIDVSSWIAGLYILRLKSSEGVYSKRVLKIE